MANGLSSPFYNNPYFIKLILHDLSLLCSFIISHPLYSSYFVYFAPYLIKLVFLMPPLFIATVLLSLLITTTTALCPKLPQLQLGILQTVVKELQSNLDNVGRDLEECNFEDFEVYKILFDGALSITFDTEEASIVENLLHGDVTTGDSRESLEKNVEISDHGGRRNDVTVGSSDVDKPEEEKQCEKLFQELDTFEECTKVIETSTEFDKVVGELQKAEPAPVKKVNSGSEARYSSDNIIFCQNSGRSSSWRSNSSSTLSSYESMREEKEWRRTLACKLFEERHNSRGGEEGMDSLWECCENDSSNNLQETMNNKSNKMIPMNNNNVGIKSSKEEKEEEEDDDEDDEPEMSNGPLCCLQALKLSTGKMNLGMRKPNIVKITRALKGFGWSHHVKKKHDLRSVESGGIVVEGRKSCVMNSMSIYD